MRLVNGLVLCLLTTASYAFSWQDLWLTQDQQAQKAMRKSNYSKAQEQFQHTDWKATAAYRAGDYEAAVKGFSETETETGHYNAGNALAHMARYEDALTAYDKALAINPNHQDALHNRKVVTELMKQDKQHQKKQEQEKQEKKDQQQEQNQPGHNQEKKDQNKQDPSEDNQAKNKPNEAKDDKANQKQQKQVASRPQSEKERTQKQWLQLIPDEPGGLMREKFLRDHLRRQRGWYQ